MLTIKDCEAIMNEVRTKFKGGYKSSNKVYAPDLAPKWQVLTPSGYKNHKIAKEQPKYNPYGKTVKSVNGYNDDKEVYTNSKGIEKQNREKHKQRFLQQKNASKQIKIIRDANTTDAERLLSLSHAIAGNCGEMQNLASALALQKLREQRDDKTQVFKGSIKGRGNGDHAFCIVSPEHLGSKVFYKNVDEFAKTFTIRSKTKIIDPWLNVACYAYDYRGFAYNKFLKWTKDGKRVIWSGKDGLSMGWYPPAGVEYWTAFKETTFFIMKPKI